MIYYISAFLLSKDTKRSPSNKFSKCQWRLLGRDFLITSMPSLHPQPLFKDITQTLKVNTSLSPFTSTNSISLVYTLVEGSLLRILNSTTKFTYVIGKIIHTQYKNMKPHLMSSCSLTHELGWRG